MDELPGLDDAGDPGSFHTALDAMLGFIRDRMAVTPSEATELREGAGVRARTAAEVAELDMVAQVWEAIDRAVRDGTTVEEFREQIGPAMEQAWGEEGWRLETVFRTNIQTAYSAGRQVQNAAVRATHPYIRYDVVDDDVTSDICQSLIGVVVKADQATLHPPLHPNCRTDEVAITAEEADELGVDEDLPEDVNPQEGFGEPLNENWEPDLTTRPAELASIYEMRLLR